jgi:YD repeat-containing protein
MNKPHLRTLRPQQTASNSSWPSELGIASTSGTSAEMRYAYFPQHRRLAVEMRGVVTIYDTAEYQFRGMLQAHSAESVGTSILTQRGRVRLTDLATVSAPTPLV